MLRRWLALLLLSVVGYYANLFGANPEKRVFTNAERNHWAFRGVGHPAIILDLMPSLSISQDRQRSRLERGVRFVELYCGSGSGWDGYLGLEANHSKWCKASDKPIAGLTQRCRLVQLLFCLFDLFFLL